MSTLSHERDITFPTIKKVTLHNVNDHSKLQEGNTPNAATRMSLEG